MDKETKEAKKKLDEERRIMIKQMGWVLQHMINIYNLEKSDEQPPIEDFDPNQISINFD